jgi:hypothetical protein
MDGVVERQLRGPHERHVTAGRPGAFGNRRVVGRQDEAIDGAGPLRRFNRVGDKRFACERLEVLPGNPLRAAARGDDAEDLRVGLSAWGCGFQMFKLSSLNSQVSMSELKVESWDLRVES